MALDQKRAWNREYRTRGRLWRGESKERDTLTEALIQGRILDNGCGNGKGTPSGRDVVGLDFSYHALSLYRIAPKVLGDMTNLPFKSEIFSNVLFIHSLDHLSFEQRIVALNEAWRVLEDEGKVIVRVFSRSDFRYGKGKEIEDGTYIRGNGLFTHYFRKKELETHPLFKVAKILNINYFVNIQNTQYKRREFIIILVKCKSGNIL